MRNIIAARRASFIRAFIHDDSGVTAIEYALIAALIAVAIIGVLMSVGNGLKGVFNSINSNLSNAA